MQSTLEKLEKLRSGITEIMDAIRNQNQADEPVPAKAGTFCSECGAEQFNSPSGLTCKNGHGGSEPAEPVILPLGSTGLVGAARGFKIVEAGLE